MTAPLVDRVRSRLVNERSDATPARVAAALRAEGLVLGDDAVLDLVRTLRQELIGAGPLEPLLRAPGVTDVIVNGPQEVWIDRGDGLERTDARFSGESDVRRLAQRLAASAGRRLDEASPFVDARLPSGVRLHCVLPPIAVSGTLISVRVPHRRAFTVDDLIDRGTLDESGARWLRAIVDGRLAFLICGGTGTGKTTILSTLLGLVPARERIVIVEDSTELAPDHPHAVVADLLAATMAAGSPVRPALAAVSRAVGEPARSAVGPVVAALDLGADVRTAWEPLVQDDSLGAIAVAMIRSSDSGAPLSSVLSRIADDLRREHQVSVHVAARAAGVKAVLPLAACFLPAFVLLGIVPVVASLAGGLFA